MVMTHPSLSPQPGIWGILLGLRGQGGKLDTGKFHSFYIGMNVCGSAYENGCVVDGMCDGGLSIIQASTPSHSQIS